LAARLAAARGFSSWIWRRTLLRSSLSSVVGIHFHLFCFQIWNFLIGYLSCPLWKHSNLIANFFLGSKVERLLLVILFCLNWLGKKRKVDGWMHDWTFINNKKAADFLSIRQMMANWRACLVSNCVVKYLCVV
jgi:hypothetical protein